MSDFLRRHVALLPDGDASAVAELYAEDGELITLEGAHSGRDAVRERFARFFEYHGTIHSAEVAHEQASGDAVFAMYRVESERGRFDILNAFVLDGDLCARHFSNEAEVRLDPDEMVKKA